MVREFDVVTKSFVREGFQIAQAKSRCSRIDIDTVFVGTDFGKGSLTTSGYPRVAKIWERGTPLSEARTVYEVNDTDVSGGASHDPTKAYERDFLERTPTFFTEETYLLLMDGSRQKIAVPDDAEISVHREWLMVKPRTPWTVGGKSFAAGSLLAARFDDYMAGKRDITLLFEPTAATSLYYSQRALPKFSPLSARSCSMTRCAGSATRIQSKPVSQGKANVCTLKEWPVTQFDRLDAYLQDNPDASMPNYPDWPPNPAWLRKTWAWKRPPGWLLKC